MAVLYLGRWVAVLLALLAEVRGVLKGIGVVISLRGRPRGREAEGGKRVGVTDLEASAPICLPPPPRPPGIHLERLAVAEREVRMRLGGGSSSSGVEGMVSKSDSE